MLFPAHSRARTRQESCGSPSRRTAQAPHSPSSQPCLVPVRPKSSRSTSSSVLYGANVASRVSPFTLSASCWLRCIVWVANEFFRGHSTAKSPCGEEGNCESTMRPFFEETPNGATHRRRSPQFPGRHHAGPDRFPQLDRLELRGALFPSEGLHPGLHHG